MVVHHWSDDGMVMYHRRSLVPADVVGYRKRMIKDKKDSKLCDDPDSKIVSAP